MDRLSQLRGEAGGSRDSTLDTTSPPSEAYMTANDTSSKFYSLSEVDSTFDISSIKDDISSIKDVSLASTATESDGTITNADELISNLSPIRKKSDILDSYKIDTQIEAANILSGGVAIFDDNDNSYDGDELVIDDNVEADDKSNSELKPAESNPYKIAGSIVDSHLITEEAHIASKDTEVVLQIDGRHVDAIDIGNGLYLYRKEGQEELAAVQISDDDQQQPSFKFLKVRENAEGNLEVYEEIEIEIPKEVPAKEGKMADKNTPSHVPIVDINKVISDSTCNKVVERKITAPKKETIVITTEDETENKESSPDKSEVNFNGKIMKFSESRKSPVIGSFTPMTYHSTPNKEGKPLTKTMVDQQLHTNRNSDQSNVKKTIEVHTDKQKINDTPTKSKDDEDNKLNEITTEKEIITVEVSEKLLEALEAKSTEMGEIKQSSNIVTDAVETEAKKLDDESIDVVDNIVPQNTQEPVSTGVTVETEITLDPSANATVKKSDQSIDVENINVENINVEKSKDELNIVDEANTEMEMEIEKTEENIILENESNQNSETKVEEVIQVDSEPEEGKDEPMEIDDEIELSIAESVPIVEENKEILEDSKQMEKEDPKEVEVAVDNKEQEELVDEPILIEDDDVSVVEEVIVESKDDKVTIVENLICYKNDGAKMEENNKNVAETSESQPKSDADTKIDKEITQEIKDTEVTQNTLADAPSDNSVVNQETESTDLTSAVVEEVKKDLFDVSLTVDKQSKEDIVPPVSLPVENKPINEVNALDSAVTLNKDIDSEPLQEFKEVKSINEATKKRIDEVVIKPINKVTVTPINEVKCATQSLPLSVDEQSINEIESSVDDGIKKDVMSKGIVKHNIPTNISPLLEQKHQPFVAPKIIREKPVEQKTEAKKSLPSVQNVNIVPEHKVESKPLITPKVAQEKPVVDAKIEVKKPIPIIPNVTTTKIDSNELAISLRKEPVSLVQVTEPIPMIAQKQLDSGSMFTKMPPVLIQATKPVSMVSQKQLDSGTMFTKVAPVLIQATKSVSMVSQKPLDSGSILTKVVPVTIKDNNVREVDNVVDLQKKVIVQPVKNTTVDKPPFISYPKRPATSLKDERKDVKVPPKDTASEKLKGVMDIEITKVPKLDPTKTNVAVKPDVISSSSKITIQPVKNKIEPKDKRELPKVVESKPINNNHAAVPFGKWTDANRQEFLNKFKTKASVTSSNSNQLKNSNDLNRRDVLKKIDSQRQSSNALSKTQEANKLAMKPETAAFSNKPNVISKEVTQETKIPPKPETVEVKPKPVSSKNTAKIEVAKKAVSEPLSAVTETNLSKKEACQRTGVVQNLIDKTIEGMIHRNVPMPKAQDEPKQTANKEQSAPKSVKLPQTYPAIEQATLDAIEMKMNELHGIPFIERPLHELPVYKSEPKSYSKNEKEKVVAPPKTKIPNLLPFSNKVQQKVKETVIEVDSEDEIIEHEPITGDIDLIRKHPVVNPPSKEKLPSNITPQIQQEKPISEAAKKDAIITEKDFDKFARRNSITYENRLTVNFDGKEPHNVVQTVVEKEPLPKSYSKTDANRIDAKAKLPYKYQNMRPNIQPAKVHPGNKLAPAADDASNRNQSKLQKAYHSALTAKRQMTAECPITIIEDKPVKVVFIDNAEYVPSQLNVQGQDLSPTKRAMPESDVTVSTCDSLDSEVLDSIDDTKTQEDTKTKTKHQRKQVLTPVDEPELELIEPSDLGIEISPKKKRKTDDDKVDRNLKYPMRKKMYMFSTNAVTEEKIVNPVEIVKNPLKETVNLNDNGVAHKNPVSALDSLVKAAELIETQTENINTTIVSNPADQPVTPVKRGRGRPRKYPLTPDGTVDKTKAPTPSPQKKPRLIDAKLPKRETFSDDSDSEGAIIKENWTMGKINENIVCPICNKLFRTENVVFKHVKHCTGPSPSRSDSDKRSPRRSRTSQDFDTKSRESKSDDMDIDDDKPLVIRKEAPRKRKSKDSTTKSDDKDDIIVIEDTPIKEKPEKIDERKHHESRKSRAKIQHKSNDLVCEFCGKTFRQLSYLVSHKLQHKKQEKIEPKKTDKEVSVATKSIYSCEVCKKVFRKLHHLVQHRIIHNPNSVPARSLRKSSSEQSESKIDREPSTSKQSDDPSAGFRCEPCDKSFRKLHHLVEHRETHDGINRQKTTTVAPAKEEKAVEKPVMQHQCDICKKTFKKLQHLNEHKEQHVETSSEKSDDKSVQSSLSTRDIIHECSLCYMVFPNEHSLNKHTIICQRKKRQSKQQKPTDETEGGDEVIESPPPEEKTDSSETPKPIFIYTKKDENKPVFEAKVELPKDKPKELNTAKELKEPKEKSVEPVNVPEKEKSTQKLETNISDKQVPPTKRDFAETEAVKTEPISEVPVKIKKIEEKEPIRIHDTPKKKTLKDKTATKRIKNSAAPSTITEEVQPAVESSDDDDVRYMLNPNFKAEDVTEEKVFMKVRAKKRSSLQIERPNSKDLVKRRTSLQHPPKIPRLKPKPVEINIATVKKETNSATVKKDTNSATVKKDTNSATVKKDTNSATVKKDTNTATLKKDTNTATVKKDTNTATVKKETKTPKLEPVPSTDSDDSETIKYSFPSTIPEKPAKPAQERTTKDSEKKIQRKSLADKRKSLSAIAKRKSLGKVITAKHKASPLKQVKKRTLDVEHRCDCGQLFSSAALLSRHTTLAHTPPRIRRRRSPPPEEKPVIKPPPRKSSAAEKPKQSPASRKSSARSDSSTSTTKPTKSEVKPSRKSQVKDAESPSDSRKAKPEKSEAQSSVKPRRTGAHRGVPVPDKMRKLMQKK